MGYRKIDLADTVENMRELREKLQDMLNTVDAGLADNWIHDSDREDMTNLAIGVLTLVRETF